MGPLVCELITPLSRFGRYPFAIALHVGKDFFHESPRKSHHLAGMVNGHHDDLERSEQCRRHDPHAWVRQNIQPPLVQQLKFIVAKQSNGGCHKLSFRFSLL